MLIVIGIGLPERENFVKNFLNFLCFTFPRGILGFLMEAIDGVSILMLPLYASRQELLIWLIFILVKAVGAILIKLLLFKVGAI